jgi:hypothetical protein
MEPLRTPLMIIDGPSLSTPLAKTSTTGQLGVFQREAYTILFRYLDEFIVLFLFIFLLVLFIDRLNYIVNNIINKSLHR